MSLHRRAEEVFLAMVALPRERWPVEIAARCVDDPELEGEVRSLLDCHEVADGFLDGAALPGAVPARAIDWLAEELPAGTRIGGYTIERHLGHGGMGNVYIAQQDRPRRTVALKVIRRGLATPSLLRRFEHEAEILGRLQHPGIAQIYEAGSAAVVGADGGATEPRPFIAMELIDGQPLNIHADAGRLDVKARMELVARVADAVHHAHQRGVIHRDLKPANVLVDAHGQPKVLDFGVARAADADLRVTTLHTSVGQLIGTLPYMSPEQVVGDPSEVDTRSDVYALGVVLYQLLTGRLPLDVSSRSLVEAARVIREEMPTRLGRVSRALRGDAETIVGKALEKDKSRRYQSAAELADDLRRAATGRPIVAKQESALYVLRRQIRRNKGPIAVVVSVIVGLLAFAIYANREASRYESLAIAENAAKTRADAAAARLEQELVHSNIERGRLLAVSGNLDAAERIIWPEHLRDINSRYTFFALWEMYSRSPCEATLPGGTAREVARIALSADGRLVATEGAGSLVAVWDTETLERVCAFGEPSAEPISLAFSASGVMATGEASGRVMVWDPRTGAAVRELRAGGPAVLDMAFDRKGGRLAVAHRSGMVVLPVDGPGSAAPASWEGSGVHAVAFSPAADEIAMGCVDHHVRIASLPGLSVRLEIANPEDDRPRMAYSPDGTRIAAGGGARLTRVWETATGALAATLAAPNGPIAGVAFTPDGRGVLTIGWWHLQVWDLATARVLRSYSGFAGSGTDVAVSPDGRLAWVSQPPVVRAWEIDPLAGHTRIQAPTTRTLAVFGRAGELVVGEADGTVAIVADPGGEPIATLGKSPTRIRSIAVSPDRAIAASVSRDGELCLWDLGARSLLGRWDGFRMPTNDGVRFDATGSRLVLPGRDFAFRVVEAASGRELLRIPSDGEEPLSAAFSPDGALIATTTRRGFVRLYDAATGGLVRELERAQGTPWTVVFSPDGSRVVSGSWSRTIDVWSVATGRLERSLRGHTGLVTDLAFRPREPSILASSGADGLLMLWDLSTEVDTPVLTMEGFEGWEVWALDFDARGRRLMATNSLGTTVAWDLRHFNRHIGGNMASWIERHRALATPGFDEAAAMEQRALLLTRGRPPEER